MEIGGEKGNSVQKREPSDIKGELRGKLRKLIRCLFLMNKILMQSYDVLLFTCVCEHLQEDEATIQGDGMQGTVLGDIQTFEGDMQTSEGDHVLGHANRGSLFACMQFSQGVELELRRKV